jgi:hypothetical protein
METENESQELPVFDDGPTEDVDIEITEDDLGENLDDFEDVEQAEEPEQEESEEAEPETDEDQEEEEEEVKPKRRRSSENRIAELARRAAEAERRAQEAEARVAQESELRQQSDVAMMTHYEQRLKRDADYVKAQLQDAISIGDSEQQVELQSKLYQLQSELSGVDGWKQQQAAVQQQAAAQPKVETPPQNEQRQVSLEPRTAQWIQRNTWFQPQSPEFDPEMHEEATLYAKRIERRLRADGREDEIGSADYFKQIDQHIRTEFADAFDDVKPVKKAAPPMRRDGNVAAVNRSAPDNPSVKSKVVRLTGDQRRIAHNMADSGAYKKPNGQRMTHAEAEKYHASFILKQNRK